MMQGLTDKISVPGLVTALAVWYNDKISMNDAR